MCVTVTDVNRFAHPDHIGNVEEFPKAMLLVQKAEYEWPDANGKPRFSPAHPVTKPEGDYDVFGGGSVTIISTPGHTPGRESLLVKLPKAGTRLLTGDACTSGRIGMAASFPASTSIQAKSATSMARMADILAKARRDLDQPRQAAARVAQARAGVLRVTYTA